MAWTVGGQVGALQFLVDTGHDPLTGEPQDRLGAGRRPRGEALRRPYPSLGIAVRGTIIRLRRRAILAFRPEKVVRSLIWASSVARGGTTPIQRPEDIPLDVLARVGAHVFAADAEKRSRRPALEPPRRAARQ